MVYDMEEGWPFEFLVVINAVSDELGPKIEHLVEHFIPDRSPSPTPDQAPVDDINPPSPEEECQCSPQEGWDSAGGGGGNWLDDWAPQEEN